MNAANLALALHCEILPSRLAQSEALRFLAKRTASAVRQPGRVDQVPGQSGPRQ